MIESEFYCIIDKDIIQCLLCPNKCIITNNKFGICRARKNISGKLFSTEYNSISALNIDPIEKKPLYHYYPSSYVFSLGTSGCNMKCGFCQNHNISHDNPPKKIITSEQIIEYSLENNCLGIAYTYNEPIIWYEFALETAEKAKKNNLKNIFVTNGNINPEPLEKLLNYTDAANVDIKTFSDKFYKQLGGNFEAVKNTVKTCFQKKIHIEISSLIVPDIWNKDIFEDMCRWLSKISPFIPLHINKYFPAYKYTIKSTDENVLIQYKNIADKYLQYVYIGNAKIFGMANTYCHNCSKLLIERIGYSTKKIISESRCKKCGADIPIVL